MELPLLRLALPDPIGPSAFDDLPDHLLPSFLSSLPASAYRSPLRDDLCPSFGQASHKPFQEPAVD